MTRFRLLADDLTGALDSAARLLGRFGPIPVAWGDDPAAPVLALDSATRDVSRHEARARVAALAPALAAAEFAFKKLDSLLRGHAAAELAGCLPGSHYNAVVIAPAFPAQRRITRHGRQLAHGHDVGVDLAAELADEGIDVARRRPGDDLPPGVSLWDAETDADLDVIAKMARGRVLWCGTGGLAGALARAEAGISAPLTDHGATAGPVLALIGSDHAVARAQVQACGLRLTLHENDTTLPGHGTAVDVALPAGIDRAEAAQRIDSAFAALLARIERPGALVVAGGETLRGVCAALGARGLVVDGEVMPGIAAARLDGGRWDGLRIVAKSGAFGDPTILAALLQRNAAP
jgi:uncharacterized protein YgbK (DUF1537 family)